MGNSHSSSVGCYGALTAQSRNVLINIKNRVVSFFPSRSKKNSPVKEFVIQEDQVESLSDDEDQVESLLDTEDQVEPLLDTEDQAEALSDDEEDQVESLPDTEE